MGLIEIARKIKGNCCEHLVKYVDQEITVNGISVGIGEFKIDIGKLSNKIKEFNSVPEVMKALDNTQYLLCLQASSIDEYPSLKELCLRIRLIHILALTQLQAMLSVSKPSRQLRTQIQTWIERMNKLTNKSIELIKLPLGEKQAKYILPPIRKIC